MKPVYKCDYCSHMGTEDEIREHEPVCMSNYDRKSCYTCKHRGKLNFIDSHIKYECKNGEDIPEDNIIEFCDSYERKEENGIFPSFYTEALFNGAFNNFIKK